MALPLRWCGRVLPLGRVIAIRGKLGNGCYVQSHSCHQPAALGESLPYFLGFCSYVKSPLIISADLSRYSSGVVYLQYCGYCDNERLLDELSKQKPKLKASNDHDR